MSARSKLLASLLVLLVLGLGIAIAGHRYGLLRLPGLRTDPVAKLDGREMGPGPASEPDPMPAPVQAAARGEGRPGTDAAAGPNALLDSFSAKLRAEPRGNGEPIAGLESLGGYRGPPDPFHSRLPSGVEPITLTLAHFRSFSLAEPIPDDVRSELVRLREARARWRTDEPYPPPPAVRFDVPASAIPGHFYLFGRGGAGEVRTTGAAASLEFAVDANGAETGPRTPHAAVQVEASEDGMLFWGAKPVALGNVRKLTPAELRIDDRRLILELDGTRVEAAAERGAFAGAYAVDVGGELRVFVDWGPWAEPERCFPSEQALYGVLNGELVAFGRLDNDCRFEGLEKRPLDELRPCPERTPKLASTERPTPPGDGPEYLGGSLEEAGVRSWQLPSVVDPGALARKHLPRFPVEGPVPADLRRSLAQQERDGEHCEAVCSPPPFVPFRAPESEVPGHFYVFGPKSAAEAKPTGIRGQLVFDVDEDGCEEGDRQAGATVQLDAGAGILFWSQEPTALGAMRRLTVGKELQVTKRRFDVGHGWQSQEGLQLTLDGRRVEGPAAGSRLKGAYVVAFGGKPLLLADFGSSPEAVCTPLVLYAIREELAPVGSLGSDACGQEGADCERACLGP